MLLELLTTIFQYWQALYWILYRCSTSRIKCVQVNIKIQDVCALEFKKNTWIYDETHE